MQILYSSLLNLILPTISHTNSWLKSLTCMLRVSGIRLMFKESHRKWLYCIKTMWDYIQTHAIFVTFVAEKHWKPYALFLLQLCVTLCWSITSNPNKINFRVRFYSVALLLPVFNDFPIKTASELSLEKIWPLCCFWTPENMEKQRFPES